jgi:hypothetical protein
MAAGTTLGQRAANRRWVKSVMTVAIGGKKFESLRVRLKISDPIRHWNSEQNANEIR